MREDAVVDEEELLRIQALRGEAFQLGYRLTADEAPNIEPLTHVAVAFPATHSGQATVGRFLAYGESVPDAMEKGLEAIRAHVEQGEPWPEID